MKNIFQNAGIWVAAAFCVALTASCNQSEQATYTDTPTSGNIKISVDEAFEPIIDSQIQTFEGIYKRANITAEYKPEALAFQDLLTDSARLIIASRKLTPDEEIIFEQQKIIPRVKPIAIDGIALIVNKSNPDSVLTLEELKNIFSGNTTSWSQLNPDSDLGDITIVFDNNNSGSARYVKDSLTHNQTLPQNTFAAQSHANLIDYVTENKNAIGVTGVNWISDSDDSTAVNFLNKITVIATGYNVDKQDVNTYFKPYQAYLAQGRYPLRRQVYIISREARSGLGTGFASFVAGDQGQTIILKSGLVPSAMPVRIIGL